MADFQSSKTAAEIEEVLTGALLYNAAQALTEGEKAFVREKIGATALGEGIKIISHFDSLEELKAAVSNPSAGDAYSVGESLPYSLYIYDFYHDSWVDHGVIRANDITARFAQNAVVDASAWVEDTDVFVDYTYKAAISLGEVTGNDFPIVVFSPSDAVGGNFCPVCYAFDGYVEIWAKANPTTAISIPAITFITQGGGANGKSTKGITNASGGIATAGVGTAQIAKGAVTGEKIADGAVSTNYSVRLAVDAWTGDEAPYTNVATIAGILASDTPIVDLLVSDTFSTAEAEIEAWGYVYRAVTAANKISFYATEKPAVDLNVQIKAVRK